jgi:2-methylisocitrate lyase-like PEP mutase family enzyme
MTEQQRKATDFRALHAGKPFVMPNPWDAGSARVFESLGFEALATTSSGFAFTLGRRDGEVTLDEVVEHARALDRATSLPISVDLENGYGPAPEDAARAVSAAAEAGAVGGSIEDWDAEAGIYDAVHAAERIAAAREAADAAGFPFTLTARAENHIRGNPDLEDTIARLQAYERAAPTSSTPLACVTPRRSGRSPTRPRSRSTSSPTAVSTWPRSPRRAASA